MLRTRYVLNVILTLVSVCIMRKKSKFNRFTMKYFPTRFFASVKIDLIAGHSLCSLSICMSAVRWLSAARLSTNNNNRSKLRIKSNRWRTLSICCPVLLAMISRHQRPLWNQRWSRMLIHAKRNLPCQIRTTVRPNAWRRWSWKVWTNERSANTVPMSKCLLHFGHQRSKLIVSKISIFRRKYLSSGERINYTFFDPELHWCKTCEAFPKTAKDFLNHLHSEEHKAKDKVPDTPWHETQKPDDLPTFPNAPTKRTPIRGIQFFVPSTGWFCKLCSVWMGDLHCASSHLKSRTHAQKYTQFIGKNPRFENDWTEERQRAYDSHPAEEKFSEDVPPPPPIISAKPPPPVLESIPLLPAPELRRLGRSQPSIDSLQPASDPLPPTVDPFRKGAPLLRRNEVPVVEESSKKGKKKKKEKKKRKKSKKKRHQSSSSSSSSSSDSDSDSSDRKVPPPKEGTPKKLTNISISSFEDFLFYH